ncbi:MAG: type III pantothenate kinase [Actinomycetota bacterium]
MAKAKLLLAIDVGNTQSVAGTYSGDALKRHWRISTHPRKTSDEWALVISELMTLNGGSLDKVDDVVMSSVVPEATQALEAMCRKTLQLEPMIVGPETPAGIKIATSNPAEVGADRIVNAAAAFRFYGGPTIIVDFGTATTFDAISAAGEYLGGAIAPGIEISLDALYSRAARLSEIKLETPQHVIGRDTTESMQSGIIFGYAGQVDTLVRKISVELGVGLDKIKIIATGGLAETVVKACGTITVHDPLLTLKGLKLIWDLNR